MTKSLVVLDSRRHMSLTDSRLQRSQPSVSRISLWGGRSDGWLSDGLGRARTGGATGRTSTAGWHVMVHH